MSAAGPGAAAGSPAGTGTGAGALRCVLFDLDGVLRHFEPGYVRDVEARHGLAAGCLDEAAYEPALLEAVTTGRISRAQWVARIGEAVSHPQAAAEWGRQPFTLDRDLLELADGLRERGLIVAILTNGTDTIAEELAGCGLDRRVDAVFNSADIGFIKPDQRAFGHVLAALGLDPHEVFFTDDSVHKLDGAVALGMRTHLFRGLDGLREALSAALLS